MKNQKGFWSTLEKGDIVDVVAPSWRTSSDVIEKIENWVEGFGLVPRFPKGLLGKDLIYSNSLEKRSEFLVNAIQAKDSKIIWAFRGGSGAAETFSVLDRLKKPGSPKIFIGLSDITSLHLYFSEKWNWSTLHGPNLNGLQTKGVAQKDVSELKKLLFGLQDKVVFSKMKVLAPTKSQKIKASVTGGNFVVVSSLIGTPYMPETRGKLLFFEDVSERGYKIDRLLVQWEQAGLFKGVRGIVLGPFLGGKDPDGKDRVKSVWKKFAEKKKFPVLWGVESGHGKRQRAVPFNTPTTLEIDSSGRGVMTCLSGAVL